jgi:ribosomal protein S15P/S13E
MKKTLFFIILIATVFVLNAQVDAIDGMVEYQKGQNKRSSKIELAYPPEVVKDAIRESMAKQGIKEQRVKGMQVFRGVQLQGDSELSDLHFKVEPKSKKEKDISIVNLIVARSSENVALRSEQDTYKSEYGKTLLTGLVPSVASHHLDVSIKEQDESLKKAEKKLKNLQDDQKNLEERIQNLEDKLIQNKKDQESQVAEIARQRGVLESMRSRKANTTSTSK